jgi:hypothetical protein
MKIRTTTAMTVLALGLFWSAAHAQRATERYIPIGKSPGLSGKSTLMGEIRSVDAAAQTLVVGGANGERKARVTERTWIWLDRSGMRETNLAGTFTDLEAGRRVEIKFVGEGVEDAEWIKIEMTQ